MDADLAALEQRLESLIDHVRELRESNASLHRELLASRQANDDLGSRVAQAGMRLDALIGQIPR